MSFTPIRDITLEKGSIARLAAKRGETNVMVLYESTTNRVRGRFLPGHNVAHHFDFEHLPGHRYETYWDPEGILSTLPAVVSCLIGLFAGVWLLSGSASSAGSSRTFGLLIAGFFLVILGMGWSMQFPIIKKIWTSSFVLVTGGYSLMLLGIFHQTIDVWGWRRWCEPFIWIGSNALTIYLAARFLGFGALGQRIAGGPVRSLLGSYGDVLVALVSVSLLLAFARFLYRRKVFIRL
jgi:predicted acyltransferase